MSRSWRVNDAMSCQLRDLHARFPEQVMSAGAMFAAVCPNDCVGMLSLDEFWDRKLLLAERSGLYMSVAKSGVRTPVVFAPVSFDGTETMLNGHRRLISAFSHDPDMPVPYVRYGQTCWF